MSTITEKIVFTTNVNTASKNGGGRVPYDMAAYVADALSIKPVFISEYKIGEFLLGNDNEKMLIALNVYEDVAHELSYEKHALTIGYNDAGSSWSLGKADIYLNPIFNPISDIQLERIKEYSEPVVIDYNYLPSRMKRKIVEDFSIAAQNQLLPLNPKRVAIYFREANDACLNHLLELTQILHDRMGYKFSVSTGPATSGIVAETLQRHFMKFLNTEFCDYAEGDRTENSRTLERFFSTADAIIVSDDTVSTLSDAISTGSPTFLLTDPARVELIERNSGRAFLNDKNHIVQSTLIKQNRLKPLTIKNITSHWQPAYRDEWKDIANQIADIVRQRIVRAAGSARLAQRNFA